MSFGRSERKRAKARKFWLVCFGHSKYKEPPALPLFHFDRGLKLTRADLAIDFCRRQKRAFISHAHFDHMARHEYALCTPATARLYQHRFGKRATFELPYRESVAWGGLTLTCYPAGHCLGSAMLLAFDGEQSLLYTGDFKLGPSATAEPAELPHADILVVESTFGNPLYRHTPREQAIDQLCQTVRDALRDGATPVVEAYLLGKSQEVTKILSDAGFPVLQHPAIYQISRVYQECGVALGDYHLYPGQPLSGHVVIVPPRQHRGVRIRGLARTVTIAVTGWAMHERTKDRLGVDHAIALSDHADYDQLLEAVATVNARVVYCTHGPKTFVDCLRAEGFNAHPLDGLATGQQARREPQVVR